ncbi:MAG: T9SS type A sorting domain-containing protein [Candidatus Marinimicrobia bacterium]|nr:T9SS type A sorting domain-containing protein [Candidatus Neomarinimicrobiota bacterium]
MVFELWDEATPGTILSFPSGQNPVSGTVPIIVSAWASGLALNTTYIFKAQASQGGGPMIEATNIQSFTTPASENEIVDVQTITDTGTVEFPSTGVVLDIGSFTGSGDDVIEVALITEAPTGQIPDTLQLLTTTISWRFDYTGSGSFDLEITFELGAGAVPQEYQDEPGRIKLLSRPTGDTGAWEIRTFASAATDHSATFPNITFFSDFILGTATPDIIAPSISFARPQATLIGSDLNVTAQVSDDRGSPVVELIYLAGGGGIADTSVRTMLEGDPGEYSYTIPGSEVGFTGLVMQIKAVDGANNDTLTAPLSVPVSYPDNTLGTSTLPGMFTNTNGIPDSTWRLFSVPSFLTNSSLSFNIGEELELESGDRTWKVFAYNSNTGSYASPSNLKAGVGYWINQRINSGLNFTLTAGRTKELEGFDIELAPGWNLIGNPFPFSFPVLFNDSLFHGPITYNGSDWTAERGTMLPWGGYAVYNRGVTAETLILSAVPGPMLLAKATEPEELDGWLMHLSLRGEYYTDIANSIGRIKGASEQLDRFDAPEPPFIDGYITLVMLRPEWGGTLTALSSDIRSWEETDGTWDLQLRTKNATGPIALSSRLEGDLPSGNKVVLMDLQQRAVYDLTAGEVPAAITDYSERYPYYLKVMAGSAEYVGQAVDQALALLPVDFALAQNYPNPFNPSTRLQYSLTRPAPVSLKIYNLLGQEITTLYEGWQDLGRFEVVWDGRDRYGNGVATGIYFAVFRAQGRMYTSKMLLLK